MSPIKVKEIDDIDAYMIVAVREAAQKVAAAQDRLNDVKRLTKENADRINDLGVNLNALKEKIKEAREKASRVRQVVIDYCDIDIYY